MQSAQVAKDLVQETFLAAVKGWERFEKRSSGKTWLTTILKHKIVDFFRKDVRESPSDRIDAVVDATDSLFSPNGEWAMAPKPWNIDPIHILEHKKFMLQLQQCLSDLPFPKRISMARHLLMCRHCATVRDQIRLIREAAGGAWTTFAAWKIRKRHCLQK